MKKPHVACLCLSVVFLFLGVAAIVTGIAGPAWYVNTKNSTTHGLWKRCDSTSIFKETNCHDRKVFKFKKNDFELDLILALMCCSALFAIIGIISSVSMCCCQNKTRSWICCSVLNVLIMVISAGSAIGGLVYNELFAEKHYKGSYKRGWALFTSWAGAALLFINVILFISMICIKPRKKVSESIELKVQSGGRYNNSYAR